MLPFIPRVSMALAAVALGSFALSADQGLPQRAAKGAPTFSHDVAPVLYKHCTSCHRSGEIAPMSLLTYEEARPWARAIRDNVMDGTMPPWHADRAYGRFSNERRLTESEKDILARWANSGAAKGDPSNLPPQPTYPAGWTIGQPDAIVSIPADYPVPPEGEIPYQYLEAPTNFTEDRPGPDGRSALGRPDLGGDAVYRHHLQRRPRADPDRTGRPALKSSHSFLNASAQLSATVLVQLQPHRSGSGSMSTYRSRAISAP